VGLNGDGSVSLVPGRSASPPAPGLLTPGFASYTAASRLSQASIRVRGTRPLDVTWRQDVAESLVARVIRRQGRMGRAVEVIRNGVGALCGAPGRPGRTITAPLH